MNLPLKSLDSWLAWLETLSPREIELGLERVHEVLERLDLPRAGCVVHVAGTNGKGSCAVMLEALFLRRGGRVGCYTSPHIRFYNERIRVDGVPADNAEIIAAFEEVESVRDGVPLTYFEYGTLAALVVFARAKVDALVLEIGMGGRLDAVNAIEPDAGIITNVTLDHCDWLGADVETIAREKAGIMRPGRPLVFGSKDVPRTIREEAERIGADLRLAGRDFDYRRNPGNSGDPACWSWQGRDRTIDNLARPSLFGSVQLRNASAVLALAEAIGLGDVLDRGTIDKAFGQLSVPGRFQWVDAGRKWLLDVAHNADAAKVLGESLAELAWPGPVAAVIGILADKDAAAIVAALVPHVDNWVAVTPANSRAIDAAELAQIIAGISGKPCRTAGTPAEGLQYVDRHSGADTLALVTGSFYTVGPALDWLEHLADSA